VISYGHKTSDEMAVMVEEKTWWEEGIRGIFCDFSVKTSCKTRIIEPRFSVIYLFFVVSEWIFKKWDVGLWTGSSWLRRGTGGGPL